MPYYEVEHHWLDERTQSVVEKVKTWTEQVRHGQVPEGFRPIIMAAAVPGRTEARCTWEAPSKEALERLYQERGLPTQRAIREVAPFLTR